MRKEDIPKREQGNVDKEKYFGKFRGRVTRFRLGPLPKNDTSLAENGEGMPFIKAVVSQIGGQDWETNWAAPCLSFAGSARGKSPDKKYGSFRTPQIGDGVWIEFEQGDLSSPLWVGFWWFRNNMPSEFTEDDYLNNLHTGGKGKKTDWKMAETPKETHKGNAQNKDTSNETPKGSRDRDKLERLPVTMGEKSPKGFFWLIHDDKEHMRLHTPKRSYLLFEDDHNGEAHATLHAEDKVNLVENASHPVAFGDNILLKYNQHIHPAMPGPADGPTPIRWIRQSDLSQTVYTDTANSSLEAMDEMSSKMPDKEMEELAEDPIGKIKDALNDSLGKTGGKWEDIGSFGDSMQKEIKDKAESKAEELMSKYGGKNKGELFEDVKEVGESIKNNIQNKASEHQSKDGGLFDSVTDFGKDIVNDVRDKVQEKADNLAEKFGAEWLSDGVKSLGEEIIGSVQDKTSRDKDGILNDVMSFGEDLVKNIKDKAIGKAKSLVKEHGGQLLDKAIGVAKSEALNAINSVVPVKTAMDVGRVLKEFAQGDTSGGLKAAFDAVSGSIPGSSALKATVGMALGAASGKKKDGKPPLLPTPPSTAGDLS